MFVNIDLILKNQWKVGAYNKLYLVNNFPSLAISTNYFVWVINRNKP